MNILMPVHVFTDDPKSGLHTVIWNTAKHLAAKGNKIYIITTFLELYHETKASLKQKNIYLYKVYNFEVHNLGPAEALMTFIFSGLLRLFTKFDWIYIIDTSKTPFSTFKLGAKLACRILTPPTPEREKIYQGSDWSYDRQHKDFEEEWEKRKLPFSYRLIRFLAINIWFKIFPVKQVGENADLLFCQGQETLSYYKKLGYHNVFYLPNGIEDYRFDNYQGDLIKTNNRFIYLFIGRIVKRKGIFYLLAAFKELAKKYSDIDLWIVGKGSKELTDLFKKETGELLDRRIFLFGELNREEIVKYLKSVNVIIDSSVISSFSSTILEGLYCKKPVIGPAYGGNQDFVKDGSSGFLVDVTNLEVLKEKMEFYYCKRSEAEEMAQRGYEFVKNNLTWSKVTDIIQENFTKKLN